MYWPIPEVSLVVRHERPMTPAVIVLLDTCYACPSAFPWTNKPGTTWTDTTYHMDGVVDGRAGRPTLSVSDRQRSPLHARNSVHTVRSILH